MGIPSTVVAAFLALPIGFVGPASGVDLSAETTAPAEVSASAADITPTEVTDLAAAVENGTLQVTGAAVFGGQAPLLVGEDPTGSDAAVIAQTSALGLDISELYIHQPDPETAELEFIVRVTQLDSEPPPEVIRYMWRIFADGEEYWLQAKTSDVASTGFADDPEGTLEHNPGSFRLRGDCGPVTVGDQEAPATGCAHVSWLAGAFDPGANEIRMTLPLESSDAPEFAPGATLSGTVEASLQAVVSNASTTDAAIIEDDYIIPGKQVLLGIAPAGVDPNLVEFTTLATLAEDDTFTGDLDIAELEAGDYEVFAKGCFADNCGVRSAPITVQ